jgi:uncharacterized protein (DUF4415 family)
MKKRHPELPDNENPEWAAEDFSRARPASEMLPSIFGEKVAREMLMPRGRPKAAVTKERITIRLSLDVVRSFRATGEGWQTRVDAALRDWLKTHTPA